MPEKLVLQFIHVCVREVHVQIEKVESAVDSLGLFGSTCVKSLHEQFNAIYFRIRMEKLKLILPTLCVCSAHLMGYMVTYGIRNFTTIQVPKPINIHKSDFHTLLKSSGSIKLRFPDCLQLFFAFEKKWAIVHYTPKKAVQEIAEWVAVWHA